MVNLINNAAKFTTAGRVEVRAEPAAEGWVQISVSDTGPGIAAEDAVKIFDKFHQVTKRDTLEDKPTGTGLGLSICKQIVEYYGGRIWVDSEVGKGSQFNFTLPPATTKSEAALVAQPVPSPAGESVAAPRPPGREEPLVLIVDDDPGIRNYLTQLLEQEGYRVVPAANGRQAIEAAEKDRPDLITMDLRMPDMDGRTAIDHLKGDLNLKSVPIVVISEVTVSGKPVGDAFVDKPIDEDHLLASMARLLGTDGSEAATGSAGPGQAQPDGLAPRVMVVDDDPAIRSYLVQVMENEGYSVLQADNGQRALDLARRKRPNLITMDLRMPDMDGKTAIGLLRTDSTLQQIPIIVISALPDPDQAGGDASFEKPVDDEALLASARLLLRQYHDDRTDSLDANQDYLVVNMSDRETKLPSMPAADDHIVYCGMEEIDQRLLSGFSGMLVVPAEFLKELNLQDIFQSSKVQGVIIDGSRGCAAGSEREERVDGPKNRDR
jgi:CheY-like chemotaxis protein